MRRIERRLRPEALDELGLPSAMAALATAIAGRSRIPVERRLEPDLRLELSYRGGSTLLVLRDDGRGLAPGSPSCSNRLRGMRERAMLIGAKLSIDSHHAGGTEVRLTIPTSPRRS